MTNTVAEYHKALDNGILVRPNKCSNCGKACNPDGHHKDYAKPLEVEWLCGKCHGKFKGKCINKHLSGYSGHIMLFKETLWELLSQAAARESAKQGKPLTVAEYVRRIVTKHLKRIETQYIDITRTVKK